MKTHLFVAAIAVSLVAGSPGRGRRTVQAGHGAAAGGGLSDG